MSTSGTTNFSPSLGDMVIEAYSRCQVRPTSLTPDHMVQARQSAQFLLSEWTVKSEPVNLWKISLIQIALVQGQATYAVPSNVVALLDAYIRQFQMAAAVNLSNAFSTVLNSATVTVAWPNHGQVVGNQIAVPIPVAIGGLVLQGFYQVLSVPDAGHVTFTAASPATGTINNAGTVPSFTTVQGSATVTVTLAGHGLAAGNVFTVQAATTVGGLTLSGPYSVVTAPSSGSFTIAAAGPAGAGATAAENGGAAEIAGQLANADPIDRVIFPISRSEYSAQPDKLVQAFPTTFWWNRQINSQINLWQVPDGNGPYVFNAYVMTQIQDAVLPGGIGLDIPNRFFEAFAAGLAARLARKFAPGLVGELRLEAQAAWDDAAKQDTENVPLFIAPGLGGYYR